MLWLQPPYCNFHGVSGAPWASLSQYDLSAQISTSLGRSVFLPKAPLSSYCHVLHSLRGSKTVIVGSPEVQDLEHPWMYISVSENFIMALETRCIFKLCIDPPFACRLFAAKLAFASCCSCRCQTAAVIFPTYADVKQWKSMLRYREIILIVRPIVKYPALRMMANKTFQIDNVRWICF